MEPGAGESELESDKIPRMEVIVSVCAGSGTLDDESNIIRLLHYTTQEYFECRRETWNHQAQQEIASACITCLSFITIASGASRSDKDFEARLAENVFFENAATNWAHHELALQQGVSQLALLYLCDEALVVVPSICLKAGTL